MTGRLSDPDHELMDAFLERTFERVRSQSLGKADFVESIALIVTAIDLGRHDEALKLCEDETNRPASVLRLVSR